MIANDIYDTVPKLDGSYPTTHIEKKFSSLVLTQVAVMRTLLGL